MHMFHLNDDRIWDSCCLKNWSSCCSMWWSLTADVEPFQWNVYWLHYHVSTGVHTINSHCFRHNVHIECIALPVVSCPVIRWINFFFFSQQNQFTLNCEVMPSRWFFVQILLSISTYYTAAAHSWMDTTHVQCSLAFYIIDVDNGRFDRATSLLSISYPIHYDDGYFLVSCVVKL